jgi:predicted glutamine amidotransferase
MYGRSQLTRDLHQAPRHEDGWGIGVIC